MCNSIFKCATQHTQWAKVGPQWVLKSSLQDLFSDVLQLVLKTTKRYRKRRPQDGKDVFKTISDVLKTGREEQHKPSSGLVWRPVLKTSLERRFQDYVKDVLKPITNLGILGIDDLLQTYNRRLQMIKRRRLKDQSWKTPENVFDTQLESLEDYILKSSLDYN